MIRYLNKLKTLHCNALHRDSLLRAYCISSAAPLEPEVEHAAEKVRNEEKSKYCIPVCYCDRSPVGQIRNDYTKMYSIDNSLFDGPLNAAVPNDFRHLQTCIDDNHMMIRKPALDVLDIIDQAKAENTKPEIILKGVGGVGKSMTMLQLLHYGVLKNMVVVYIPHGGMLVDSIEPQSVLQSEWNTSRVDQPEESLNWLNLFQSMNGSFLKEAKTTQGYKWGKRDHTEAGVSLAEIINLGKGRSIYATDAVGVILKELQLNQDLQVLFAIDGVNWLFIPPIYKLNMMHVDLHSLSLVRHFTKLLQPESSFSNGITLTSVSASIPFFKQAHHKTLDPHDVVDPLNWKLVNSFVDVNVDYYNEEEFLLMLNFYKDKGWIQRELTDDFVDQIRFLSQRHPYHLYKMLRSL